MSKFEFNKKNNIELDIAGNKFAVVYNAKLVGKMKQTGKEISDKVGKLKDGEYGPEVLDNLIKMASKAIDELCGEGASEKIFGDSEHTILDYYDVLIYLTDEIKKFKGSTLEKYNPTRAKRK